MGGREGESGCVEDGWICRVEVKVVVVRLGLVAWVDIEGVDDGDGKVAW